MPAEFYVVLIGVGAVLIAWLLLRFGKIIAKWGLIFGSLAAVIVLGLAALEHSRATRQAMQVAKVASVSATASTALAWLLGGLLVVALAGAGYFALRWKLAEWRSGNRRPEWLPGPNALWGRRRDRKQEQLDRARSAEPVIYVVESEPDDGFLPRLVDELGEDLSDWGW